jgi:lipopolysaccharide/colanic/teichoic acid biosynthesis glycosyltransferase
MLARDTDSSARLHRERCKRVLDIAVSVVALVLSAPPMAAICLAIRLTSSGPAVFRQQRLGHKGKPFTCLKFRTMYDNIDTAVHRDAILRLWQGECLSSDPSAPYKLMTDQRVTPIGRWLRRTSLDELPQLFNVLRGEMSIVGPRPLIPYELERSRAWHWQRHDVKPGLTGPWQVYGRGRMGMEEMLMLDVQYARNWTLRTDLKLIALTIPVVLSGRGAR